MTEEDTCYGANLCYGVILYFPAHALRALGLLLADGALTVGWGKTFWDFEVLCRGNICLPRYFWVSELMIHSFRFGDRISELCELVLFLP